MAHEEDRQRVLFATAELRPLVSAGGLGEAASGLVAALRSTGVDVTVALPDYFGWELDSAVEHGLGMPDWAGPASVRIGDHPDAGRLALVSVAGIKRPDPYVDENGYGWPDNTDRFAAFSAAVAALGASGSFDVVHLNDWHTAFAPAFMPPEVPSMLTIHNLGHQGFAHAGWLHRLPLRRHPSQTAVGKPENHRERHQEVQSKSSPESIGTIRFPDAPSQVQHLCGNVESPHAAQGRRTASRFAPSTLTQVRWWLEAPRSEPRC